MDSKHHFIITGTSKGIGEALAQQLMGEDHAIWCISRNNNPRLDVQAKQRKFFLHDFEVDLSRPDPIKEVMREIFRSLDAPEVKSITLINNAGTIRPIREIGSADTTGGIISAVNLNLLAPMLLTDAFVRLTEGWNVPRRVLNMSTGAATNPMHGWGTYCSTKAGLEMFSRCLHEEQKAKPNGVKVVAFAPGMVNTEMQVEIRSSSVANFPSKEEFVSAHEKGALHSPEKVATKVIELLNRPDFGSEPIMHIRQLL